MEVLVLRDTDAPAFRALQLRALHEHPEAFGASWEEEQAVPVEQTAEYLRSSSEDWRLFGAFIEGELVGYAGFGCHRRAKTRHKAHLGPMYVAPEARRQGAGRALLEAVVAHARSVPAVEELVLAVTVGNQHASRLYLGAGFEAYCVEPRYLKVAEQYFDIEWMILRL